MLEVEPVGHLANVIYKQLSGKAENDNLLEGARKLSPWMNIGIVQFSQAKNMAESFDQAESVLTSLTSVLTSFSFAQME